MLDLFSEQRESGQLRPRGPRLLGCTWEDRVTTRLRLGRLRTRHARSGPTDCVIPVEQNHGYDASDSDPAPMAIRPSSATSESTS